MQSFGFQNISQLYPRAITVECIKAQWQLKKYVLSLNAGYGNGNLAVNILQVGSFCPLFPGLIGMWNV